LAAADVLVDRTSARSPAHAAAVASGRVRGSMVLDAAT
jgi:hypothetical protein